MESMSNFYDNCEELTALRSFRDSYVREKYPEEIQKYYQDAPKIVQIIDKDEKRQEIYKYLYQEFVLSTVRLIKENHMDAAYRNYKKMVSSLTEKYLT
jgi:ribosomal protein S21